MSSFNDSVHLDREMFTRDRNAGQANIFENCPTGTFQYTFDTDEFLWSDEIYSIHGYKRGDIVPTYRLGHSHIVPELRDEAQSFWDDIATIGGPLSIYLTLRDANDKERRVLCSGDQLVRDGQVIGVWGLLIDLTRAIHNDSHQVAIEAIAASAARRGVIEQAKGILMGQANISAEQAFELIRQRSQDTNRKANAIAQDIVDRAATPTTEPNIHALYIARRIIESF